MMRLLFVIILSLVFIRRHSDSGSAGIRKVESLKPHCKMFENFLTILLFSVLNSPLLLHILALRQRYRERYFRFPQTVYCEYQVNVFYKQICVFVCRCIFVFVRQQCWYQVYKQFSLGGTENKVMSSGCFYVSICPLPSC